MKDETIAKILTLEGFAPGDPGALARANDLNALLEPPVGSAKSLTEDEDAIYRRWKTVVRAIRRYRAR